MKDLMQKATTTFDDPQQLRYDIQDTHKSDVWRRKAIADAKRKRPWIPLSLAVASAAQASVAANYLFHRMPKVDRAWCPHCILYAVTRFASFALPVPEAIEETR